MNKKILLILFCILITQLVLADSKITVTEGDLVRLSVVSEDPDNDNLFFTFTQPVNNKGLWQTEIGDAGTYSINTTVCDREFCDSDTVDILVLHKQLPPEITQYSPLDINLSIKEQYSIFFNIGVEDMDSSKLYLSWKVDGKEISSNLSFTYNADYHSAGHHTIRFTVSDGDLQDQILWNILVEDVNAPPILEEIKDISFTEGDLVKISPQAEDPDNDGVSYSISDPIGDDGEWQTDFDDEGEYEITITVSDGSLSDSQTINLVVKKNDRTPIIIENTPEEDKIYTKEGEEIFFSIRAVDEDDDELSYEWTIDDEVVGSKKAIKYTIDYDSAGIQTVKCTISDGTVKVSRKWTLIIENVNQAPVIIVNESYTFNESDLVKISPKATDLDNDDIIFSFSPPLDENGEWQTDHKSSGVYAVNISAYDGKLASSELVRLIVKDVDALPIFEEITDYYVDEGSNISIKLYAYDPDEEDIIFSAENLPEGAYLKDDELRWFVDYDTIKRHTGWFARFMKTLRLYSLLFDNNKEYKIKIAAQSGESFSTQDLKIVVFDNNRIPVIEAPDKIVAEENELVIINYSYYDADDDNLNAKISKPFNLGGKWQTDFEDGGEYNITIEVDDNLNKTVKTVFVSIEDKNREPFLNIDDYIKVKAGKEVKLEPKVIELDDNDNVTFSYSGWMDSDSYLTDENDTGVHTVTVSATDGIETVSKDITIEVKEGGTFWFYFKFVLLGLLLLAILILILSLIERNKVKKEKEPIEEIEEEKTEELEEPIKEAKAEVIPEKEFKEELDEEETKTFHIPFKWIIAALIVLLIVAACVFGTIFLLKDNGDVKFKNIKDQKIDENGLLEIEFKTKNADGIDVYNLPRGSMFKDTMLIWTPDYEQAGKYNISATAYNNQSNISQEFTITVKNINRAPEIISTAPLSTISVYTGRKIQFKVITEDGDEELLTYTWYFGLDKYNGNSVMNRTFTVPGKKTIKVKVCDREDCVSYTWKAKVVNYVPRKSITTNKYVITEVENLVDDGTGAGLNTYVVYGSDDSVDVLRPGEIVEVIESAEEIPDDSYNINTYEVIEGDEEVQFIQPVEEEFDSFVVYG